MTTFTRSPNTLPVRIRFSGTQDADTLHLPRKELLRLYAEWKAFLGGSGAIGGEYMSEESDAPLIIALHFHQIAYIEPGKVY